MKPQPKHRTPAYIQSSNIELIEIVDKIYPVMNKFHDLNYSKRFWLWILSDYIKSCLERKSIMNNKNYVPKKLFLPILGRAELTKKRIKEYNLIYFLRGMVKGGSLKELKGVLKGYKNICLGIRAEELESHGVGKFAKEFYPWRFFQIPKNRKAFSPNVELKDPFLQNLVKEMPLIYTKYFRGLIDSIDLFEPENKNFHYEHAHSVYSIFTMAKYQEFGSVVKLHQTGGFMGEVTYSPSQSAYEIIDELVTYGWKINPKDKPGKPYRLMKYARQWNGEREKIHHPVFDIMLVFSTADNLTIPHYKKFFKEFISNIDKEKYPKILVRPRPITSLFGRRSNISYLDNLNGVTVDSASEPMYKAAAGCKLIVHSRTPSTNFLESLYAGQPIVVLDTNPAPTELAKVHYKNLKDLKIMFDEPKDMAIHLNKIDLDQWWKNVTEDSRYKKFTREYAGKH